MKLYNKKPTKHQLDFESSRPVKIIKFFAVLGGVFLFFVTLPLSIIPGALFLIYLKNERLKKKLRKQSVEIIATTPPRNLRPAEIGFLYDNSQSVNEIISILFYLILEGYISMEIIKSKDHLNAGEYILRVNNKDQSSLRKYECMFIDVIFGDSPEILWSDFRNGNALSKSLSDVSLALQQELQRQGYYFFREGFENETYLEALGKEMRKSKIVLIKDMIWNMGLGMLRYLTDKGKSVTAEVLGFKKYLEMAEQDRIMFHADPDKGLVYIGDMMPYATALGVVDIWQDELFGIEMDKG